jgi:CheY-like chemotaxis protein
MEKRVGTTRGGGMSELVNILLVEDDKVDVMALRRAFLELKIANPIKVARDGIEALEVLRGTNGTPPLSRPHLVLLDLDLPRMNGIEFLKELRNDEKLSSTIVFVLTTSKQEEDRIQAYNLNVAGYMVKSLMADSFMQAVTMLKHYWRVVVFP